MIKHYLPPIHITMPSGDVETFHFKRPSLATIKECARIEAKGGSDAEIASVETLFINCLDDPQQRELLQDWYVFKSLLETKIAETLTGGATSNFPKASNIGGEEKAS